MSEMPKVYDKVQLAFVDSDESDLVDVLEIENVQTVVVIHPEVACKKPEKVQVGTPEQLTELVAGQNTHYATWYEAEKKKAFRDIESYINTHPFFIFMKGSKE